MPTKKFKPGTLFWLKSEAGVGQEETGRHLWVVLSNHEVERRGLLLAVPTTTNPIEQNNFQLTLLRQHCTYLDDIADDDRPRDADAVVKCEKVRHWSVDREVVIVGRVTDRERLNVIRRTAGIALGIVLPPR